ncbi:MAG TPA: thiol-activated cytolysin family protein [Chitinophagaceae bacterium]|nr:thiol-activated cytolysin family protein [Chitinophagaceae bacterium]
MKTFLALLAFSLFSLPVFAQPVIKKTTQAKLPANTKAVVIKKETRPIGTPALKYIKPGATYKVNPGLANILASMPSKTIMVNGHKITSKMIATNGLQLVTPASSKVVGVTQKTTNKGSSSTPDQACQSFTVKVSANSENFDVPYGTQASHIYPGAAYMYDDYYKNTVSPKSITWKRNPIYIQAASSSGNGKFELVEDPTQVNLNAAAGRIKSSLSSVATNESTSISMMSLYDEADFYLKVNGGGGGFGFKADASFGIANSSKKSYFLIDAVQTFYTLNAIKPEGDTAGFFQDRNNDAQTGALFMASVSYGRRVLGVLETEFKDEKMFTDFKASYTSGFAGGYAGLDMINGMNSQSTKVKLYFVGGNAASIEVPNATEASVRDAINNYLRTTTTQNAVPIKFTFRNMAMSGMRYESATDNFTYQQCVPIQPELKYNVKINLMMILNSKNEEVKFGLKQYANFYAWDKQVFQPGSILVPLLCWMETNEPFKSMYKAEAPRNFTRSTDINRAVSYQVKQADILDGAARVELFTDYIAMYATKVFGSTNDANPKKKEIVYIRDVITSGGGSMTKDVQINFNGRVFTIRFVITATPA